jgi:hypothetical protein
VTTGCGAIKKDRIDRFWGYIQRPVACQFERATIFDLALVTGHVPAKCLTAAVGDSARTQAGRTGVGVGIGMPLNVL